MYKFLTFFCSKAAGKLATQPFFAFYIIFIYIKILFFLNVCQSFDLSVERKGLENFLIKEIASNSGEIITSSYLRKFLFIFIISLFFLCYQKKSLSHFYVLIFVFKGFFLSYKKRKSLELIKTSY